MPLPMFHIKETGIDNADYDDDHRYQFGFSSNAIQIHFRSGTGPIFYSFDGQNDHGELNNLAGSIQTQVLQPFRANQIWLRGGDGTEIVEVYATPQAGF